MQVLTNAKAYLNISLAIRSSMTNRFTDEIQFAAEASDDLVNIIYY